MKDGEKKQITHNVSIYKIPGGIELSIGQKKYFQIHSIQSEHDVIIKEFHEDSNGPSYMIKARYIALFGEENAPLEYEKATNKPWNPKKGYIDNYKLTLEDQNGEFTKNFPGSLKILWSNHNKSENKWKSIKNMRTGEFIYHINYPNEPKLIKKIIKKND